MTARRETKTQAMIRKYSKPAADILKIKESFFKENDRLYQENVRWAEAYRAQPRRTKCKNCNAVLSAVLFTKMNIDYFLCGRCNHLNGGHEDTAEFVRYIYAEEDGTYAQHYGAVDMEAYLTRVKAIYQPKADFLVQCLDAVGEKCSDLGYCDIGAGSGYFVYALRHGCGFKKVAGYEVSPKQVALANEMLAERRVTLQELGEPTEVLTASEADVVSMIGVLEHLRDPRAALERISANRNIRYLYLCLPLFSYSVFFELVNQQLYNRQLAGDHTHLYTLESLSWLCKEFGFGIVGEWLFGTDAVDLFRFISVQMGKLGCNEQMLQLFSTKFSAVLDGLQQVMDHSGFCSEVHVLLSKTRAE